ncbi:halocyanin [Haloarcula rubripromontorii]|uniref:Halocyanin n=1 Tax=Haloarcula rubripromontorii TaxID=1705562 RepID=A0A0N0BQF1_9EURY|nr:halocyanin [Haloarcula rubripromontorii]
MSRRGFLRTAAGATAASAAAGTATAQESTEGGDGGGGGGPPDFGGFLDQVGNFDGSVADATGQDTATVEVGVQANGGAFGFGPPAIHVDNGATVQFEWTGNGGGHNVVSDGEGPLDSGSAVSSAGVNYEHTFEEDGIYPYVCVPHEGLGMKGAVVVGTDYPTKSSGGSGGSSGSSGPPEVPNSAKTLGVATSFVMVATLGLAYFFIRYGGDYETPE